MRVSQSLVGLGILLFSVSVGAVSTRSFSTSTYKEFDEGEADHSVITSQGEVLPGASTRRTDLETDAIWTAVRGPDGTIYAGAISDGAIYSINSSGKKKLAALDKDTPWIGALALAPDGTLYAGTLGTGTIFSIDTRTGKVAQLVKLDGANHVWSLVVDGKTLWAGTGPSGKLFSVELPSGKAKPVFDVGDTHIMSMIRAADGALWLGTAEEAILYRYEPQSGKARAIADFAGSEVKAIVEVDGGVVVAVNEFEPKTGAAPAPAPAGKGPKGTPVKAPEAGSAPGADKVPDGMPARTEARKGKGALFRVEPDGRLEQLHALAEGYFMSLAAGPEGEVYAGAGAQGRVYEVRKDRSVITAFDVSERQVNAVMADRTGKDGVAFATGDSGAVYVSVGPAKDARYTSKVFDALFSSHFGNLRYRGGGFVVETRSGNTAKPSKGWSSWEKLAAVSRMGGDAMAGHVQSPPGRYIQYRVTFDGAAADVLREAELFYLPQNQRARVTDVSVVDAEPRHAPVTLAAGPTKSRSTVVKIRWKVDNQDDDELVYKVEIKSETDPEWRDLSPNGDPITAPTLDWNTEAWPDGFYRVRVSTSDRRANPRDLALDDTFTSPPFLIDNQRPQIEALEVKFPDVTGKAVDGQSRISEIAYQIDTGEWTMAFPKDGIFDDLSEPFAVKLPADLAPGTHTLSVRVADEASNIGATATTFKVSAKR